MDFFARQDQARRKTKWLIGYFIAAVVVLIISVYVVALVIFAGVGARQHHHHYYQDADQPAATLTLWNPTILLGATFGVLAVVFLGSAYKTSELAAGGSAVATLMGGQPVSQDTTDADERKLLNVVEEMSIAAGVPMPKVYVLNEERGINAFAAGHTTSDAAIGVTRGCIEQLSRDELQGVIGHEFSHILNGDMRLNLRLIGIIFGLLCLATVGRILMSTRGGNSRDRNALPLFGLALVILGAAGVFFGRLIQAAVSRQREFLADASAVQFTRNPAGLSGALQKIGGYGSRLESEHAPDLCHMFFGNGLGETLFEPMATHPPLPERIRAIDPSWDGHFPAPKPVAEETEADSGEASHGTPPPLSGPLGAMLAATALEDDSDVPPVIRSETLLTSLGRPTPAHLEYAGLLYEELPAPLKAAVRQPLDATAFTYALLLSADDALRAKQLGEIAARSGAATAQKTVTLFLEVIRLPRRGRLPLVNLAIGAMRNLTAEQFNQFQDTLEWLVASDGQIELFEFVLQKAVRRHLAPQFGQTRQAPVQFYALKPLLPDCAVVLSALARTGSTDEDEIAQAFALGHASLPLPTGTALSLLPVEQCGLEQVGAALDRLVLAAPMIKGTLLTAGIAVVSADGVVTEEEAELLRAIADALDCPAPPLLGGA